MTRRTALTAPLCSAALFIGVVAGQAATTSPAALADGPASTGTYPVGPISGKTGAPLGDAKYGVNPLVPFGSDPQVPVTPGYVNPNHDEGMTANGQVDLPF